MVRGYSMSGVMGAAQRAVGLARRHLERQEPQGLIHDVQEDPRFQRLGVDLLWERPGQPVSGVEVKGDRQARRKHYFFELVSNLEKNTPGCFLYTTADLILYVFLRPQEVHVLPMPATRAWFLPKSEAFTLKHTTTRMGPLCYTTVGALVPVKEVLAAVSGAAMFVDE
jgi:hypothetical protein